MAIADDRAIIEEALGKLSDLGFDTLAVTGWVVVVELMDPDGKRFLVRLDGEHVTAWQREGMLHNALFGAWEADEVDP